MGIVIKHHKSMIQRWKEVFVSKTRKEGNAAAQEWALRTLTDEDTAEVAKILHQGTKK